MDRLISDERDLKLFITYLEHQKLPFTVKVTPGRHRSVEQNKLSHMWYGEISQQMDGGHTPQEVKAFCKLTFGIPILCAENDKFREAWERLAKKHSYEERIDMMVVIPVTSIMNTAQLTRYLEEVSRFAVKEGIQLTYPDDLGRAA